MKGAVRVVHGAVAAFVLMGWGSLPAAAQEKAEKLVLENDKVRVVEFRYKPGDQNTSVPREARVIRALTSGTLQRIYPDGKTENVTWKAGEVRFIPASAGQVSQYTTKNIGKSELVLYLVVLK